MSKLKTLITLFRGCLIPPFPILRFHLKLRNQRRKLQNISLNNIDILFFFPFYQVGGGERVNADILKVLPEFRKAIVFTDISKNDTFLSEFKNNSDIIFDINDFSLIKEEFNIRLLDEIQVHKKRLKFILGTNSYHFYQLLPRLFPLAKCYDLVHAFYKPDLGPEDFSLPYVEMLSKRILVNKKVQSDFKEFYKLHGVDDAMNDRFVVIYNCIDTSSTFITRPHSKDIKVTFIGRGCEEKRIHIVGKVASKTKESQKSIEFSFVGGDVEKYIFNIDRSNCNIIGELPAKEVNNHLKCVDILLITSYREGFPMVIMEAMINGVIVISTNVGGISEHIVHGENGFLVNSGSEDQIVEDMSKLIIQLNGDANLRYKISQNAHYYAKQNFTFERFKNEYRSLLLNE